MFKSVPLRTHAHNPETHSETPLPCRLSTTETKQQFFGFENQFETRKIKTKAEQRDKQYIQIVINIEDGQMKLLNQIIVK